MRGRSAALLLPLLAVAAAGAAPLATERAKASARPAVAPSLVVAQVPAAAGGDPAAAPGPAAAEGGRLVLVSPSGAARVLTAGFDSAADPDVSFDGRSILFAAKKTKADPWCVWEMKADGTSPRRISCGAAGARQPVYQSTIYTITATNVEPWVLVAFVGTDEGELDEAGAGPHTSLWSCKTDGTALRRLTYNLSNDVDPVILPDGRMVYAGWLRHSTTAGPQGRVALLGVNEDGTDYQQYASDDGLRFKRMPTPAGDDVVFVESDAIGADGGRLAAVSQVRPLHSYRSLTAEADGSFRAPAALPDGRLLVAWRQGDAGTYGVYRFDPQTKAREKVLADTAWHSLAAKPLAPRPVPDARSSALKDEDAEGKLYAIDVNLNDLGEKWTAGAAKRLRVIEGVPARSGQPAHKRVLGELPVADDGSFQVQLPANTPVQLELVGADGAALRTSAWLWTRNHGQQGCIGCHEDRELTPPNRLPKALRTPAPVLSAAPDKRAAAGPRAAPDDGRPTPEAIRAFVESIDLGGQR